MLRNYTKQLPGLAGGLLCLAPHILAAQGINITPGTQVKINGATAHVVVLNGGIVNGGVLASETNSTVHLRGNAATAQTLLGGSGNTQLYHLDIDKSANDVRMNGMVIAGGTVDLISGRLLLNGQTLDLLNTGYLNNEGPVNYVSGSLNGEIIRRTVMNAPIAFNPGNVGLEVSSAANLGAITIRRKYQNFMVSASDASIHRYYEVQADQQTGLNADIKVYYHNEDLGAANENNLFLWSSTNNGLQWNFKGRDSNDPLTKYVAKSGVDTLRWVTLSTPNAPLPLDLLSFKARLDHGNGLLSWETAKEKGVRHFEIERSANGKNFYNIGIVNSKGDKEAKQSYQFTDEALLNGLNFYRLKLVDQDGASRYSMVEVLNVEGYKDALLRVYPNPSTDKVYITMSSNLRTSSSLLLYDVTGKQVGQQEVQLEKGENTITLSLGQLLDGTYLLKFSQPTFGSVKLVKK